MGDPDDAPPLPRAERLSHFVFLDNGGECFSLVHRLTNKGGYGIRAAFGCKLTPGGDATEAGEEGVGAVVIAGYQLNRKAQAVGFERGFQLPQRFGVQVRPVTDQRVVGDVIKRDQADVVHGAASRVWDVRKDMTVLALLRSGGVDSAETGKGIFICHGPGVLWL